jgi:hypothetical protein
VRVEDEHGISGDREAVDRERVQQLGRFYLTRSRLCRADLRKAVGHIEDENDEEPVRGALDLEVAEQGVGAEEVECLVDNIVLLRD